MYCAHLIKQTELADLLHMEYPSQAFTGKKSRDNSRGRFDLVVLTEKYRDYFTDTIEKNDSVASLQKLRRPSNVKKRKPDAGAPSPVFHAVIEFKFCYEELVQKRIDAINRDFIRVNDMVSSKKATCGYVVYFQRLLKNEETFADNISQLKPQKNVNYAVAVRLGTAQAQESSVRNSVKKAIKKLPGTSAAVTCKNNVLSRIHTVSKRK